MSKKYKIAALTAFFIGVSGLTSTLVAEPNICVSISGVTRVQIGLANCTTVEGRNIAVAVNNNEDPDTGARALLGEGNLAIAINGSEAAAAEGDNNTAISVNGSDANASEGDGNVAVAINDSGAYAEGGDSNSALAVNESEANAEEGGNNTATAINESCAEAIGGGETDIEINSGNCS